MSFSNKVIVPRNPFKPHIVKMEGLWRVSKYNHKKLWRLGIGGLWIKAHAFARKLNDEILAEEQAAKERQREFKRKQRGYHYCVFCNSLAIYNHRKGVPVCKCPDKFCKGSERWLEYEDFEGLEK